MRVSRAETTSTQIRIRLKRCARTTTITPSHHESPIMIKRHLISRNLLQLCFQQVRINSLQLCHTLVRRRGSPRLVRRLGITGRGVALHSIILVPIDDALEDAGLSSFLVDLHLLEAEAQLADVFLIGQVEYLEQVGFGRAPGHLWGFEDWGHAGFVCSRDHDELLVSRADFLCPENRWWGVY